jgi:hypothetical protein
MVPDCNLPLWISDVLHIGFVDEDTQSATYSDRYCNRSHDQYDIHFFVRVIMFRKRVRLPARVEAMMDSLFPLTAMPNSFVEEDGGKTVRFYLIRGARIEEGVLRKIALEKDLDVTISNDSDSLLLEFTNGKNEQEEPPQREPKICIDPIAEEVAPRDLERISRILDFISARVRNRACGSHKYLPNGVLLLTVQALSLSSSEIRALFQNERTIDSFSIFATRNDKGKCRIAIEFVIS